MSETSSKGGCLRIGLIGIAILAVAVTAWLFALNREPEQRPPLPVPNGYDELGAIKYLLYTNGDPFQGGPQSFTLDALNEAELEQVVATNQVVLERIRPAVQMDWQVPNLTNAVGQSGDLVCARYLSFLLCAEARWAARQGSGHEAVESAMGAVSLGQRFGGSGTRVSAHLGAAISKVGMRELETLAPQLGIESCREAVTLLRESEQQDIDVAEVIDEERRYVKSLGGGIGTTVTLMLFEKSLAPYRSMGNDLREKLDEVRDARESAIQALEQRIDQGEGR